MDTPKEYSIAIVWDETDKSWSVLVKNEYGYVLARRNKWSYAGAQRWARKEIKRDLKRGDRQRMSTYKIRPGVDDLSPNSDLIWAIAVGSPALLLNIALVIYVLTM